MQAVVVDYALPCVSFGKRQRHSIYLCTYLFTVLLRHIHFVKSYLQMSNL